MEYLSKIFDEVDDVMFEKFKNQLSSPKINKNTYLRIFITTFVLANVDNKMNEKTMKCSLHNAVDETSLCNEETQYFHNVIDCNESAENYVNTIQSMYSKNKQLTKCQLGRLIKRCLDFSSTIEIV